MNLRVIDLALSIMDPRAFEDLVYALVRIDEPTARQLTPPDAGRDTIVPATGECRERAWQAKHHTSGINWSDCERSLDKAVAERNPEEVTFVFPVNMTEGKEAGLDALRSKYPQDKVRLPEPWTLGTLRQKLLDNPDIRRDHIDTVIGIHHEFARELFERGAEFKERWSEQIQAALRGPLAVFGQEEIATAAEEAVSRRDWAAASAYYEQMAEAFDGRMPSVADVLLLQAARCAGEARGRPRAGALHLRVSRSAARRGDSASEYAAFRASWELPEDERWRSFAAMARAAWPERPDESIDVLRAAFTRCLSAGDTDGIAEWGNACSDALAANGDWPSVREVAEQAAEALGPVEDSGSRVEIQLDLLDARAVAGEDVDAAFGELLLAPVARDDATSARIRARWGCVLARAGRGAEAALRFQETASAWLAAGDAEEEIGEAILSEDAASQMLGEGRRLDQAGRIAVADLRSRDLTPAAMADRKETEGMRAWLLDRGYDARRALTIAWSLHRRAGHFGGCARVAESLLALFERAEEWPEALTWAIRAGRGLKAREAAQRLAWPDVFGRLQVTGPLWERLASFEAVAACGTQASDEQVATLTEPLLELARRRDDDERAGLTAASCARRALSTVLCAIDPEHLDEALEHVRFETEHTPFPPRDCTQGLLLATDAGLCDAAELIAEVFCVYDRAHVPGFSAALQVIERSATAQAIVRERATEGFVALVLAAYLSLPDADEPLRRRAAGIIERAVDGQLNPDEILRANDRGRLSRWAQEDNQAHVARWLVHELSDPGDIDVHRYEAGEGLVALAPVLAPATASTVLDELLSRAELVTQPSTVTELRSDPNPHFARAKMSTPRATDHVRAIALAACSELASRCERLPEITADLTDALADPDGVVRAAALRITKQWPQVADVDFADLLTDDDPEVRSVALAASADRGQLLGQAEALTALCLPDQPLALRCAVLGVARESPEAYRTQLQRLVGGPHLYVRAAARHALGMR